MKKILLVEDQMDILMQLEDIVKSQGFISVSASKQKEAMKIIESDESLPDLAFLDIDLPDNPEGGIEIAKFILKMKHIPIVFITARRNEFIQKIKGLGSQIIEKGFNENQIVDAINTSFKDSFLKESADIKILSKDKLVINCDNPEPNFKGSKWHLIISVKDICFIKGDGNACRVMLSDGQSLSLATEKSHFELYIKKVMADYDEFFMHKNKSYISNYAKKSCIIMRPIKKRA